MRRLNLIVLASVSVLAGAPADAQVDSGGQIDALTDGVLLIRNSEGKCVPAPRANDRLRNAGPASGYAKERQAGRIDLKSDKEPEPAAGRGMDIARVDGEMVSPGSPAAPGLPTGKRQHKAVTFTTPVDKTAAC